MDTLKRVALAALMVSATATAGNAKSIWDQISESAPLQPVFEDLRASAPRQAVFEDLELTAPARPTAETPDISKP